MLEYHINEMTRKFNILKFLVKIWCLIPLMRFFDPTMVSKLIVSIELLY